MEKEPKKIEGSRTAQNEIILSRSKEYFGESPMYLMHGLEAWIAAGDVQAKEGLGGLKRYNRLSLFESGMATYYHQEPKDIGSVSAILTGLGKLPKGEFLPQKREYKEDGKKVTTEFESLFTNGSDADLYKAGFSFYGGNVLYENLRRISQMGIDSTTLDLNVVLSWRQKDYDVHRRDLDGKELELLVDALKARDTYLNFSAEHMEEYVDGTMTEETEAEQKQLKQISENALREWWLGFCKALQKK